MNNTKADRTIRLLRTAARWGNLEESQEMIREIITNDWWRSRTVDGVTKEYQTFAHFCQDTAEHGLETDVRILKKIADEDEETGRLFREATISHGGDRKSKSAPIKSDNVPLDAARGNSKSYLATRLHKDHPEIYQRVLNGELSVYAGAVEAGIKKRNFSIPIDPDRAANSIINRFEFNDLVKLRDLISLHIESI